MLKVKLRVSNNITNKKTTDIILSKWKENTVELEKMLQIYEEAFPIDERRDLSKEREMITNKKIDLYILKFKDSQKVLGFIAIWNFNDVLFIEHFAIKKEERTKGYGSLMFKSIQDNSYKKVIVLELEPPESSSAAQLRIKFYKRLGVNLNNFDYIQPPYSDTKKPVKMIIASYPRILTNEEFNRIKTVVYQNVYGIKL